MSLMPFFDTYSDPFQLWSDRMERLLAKAEGGDQQQQLQKGGQRFVDFVPNLDVHETEKNILVETELPGIPKDQIKVDISNNVLTISGEHKNEQEKDERGYRVRERSYGSFQRRVALPKTADTDKVTAKYENGVLHLTVPKKELPQPEKKAITIS